MKRKFKVAGIFRGISCDPEVFELDLNGNETTEEIKEILKKKACLTEITSIKELES